VRDIIKGDDLGLLGVSMGWGVKPMSVHSGKRIDRERIETERSLNRQASKAIHHCSILSKE
jgi:hypothetical protein